MTEYRSLAELQADIAKFAKDVNGGAVAKHITNAAAIRAVPLARRAASSKLGGDNKFSGWKPRLTVVVSPGRKGSSIIHPTKTSAGPWTVAQDGRHADGASGGFQGPSVSARTGRTSRKKDGTISTANRRRKVSKWNGMTRGKGVADDADALFRRHVPGYIADEYEQVVKRRLG